MYTFITLFSYTCTYAHTAIAIFVATHLMLPYPNAGLRVILVIEKVAWRL